MKITCDVCGSVHERARYFFEKMKHHYCSRECYRNPKARFLDKIDKSSGCWIWTGCLDHGGYGIITVAGKRISAHRHSWETFKGPIPVGMCVCHNCPGGDNRACVNPDHLWIGSQADNMKDAGKKLTLPYGVNHRSSKLTEHSVRKIKEIYQNSKCSMRDIAKAFSISNVAVFRIVHGITWKHLA